MILHKFLNNEVHIYCAKYWVLKSKIKKMKTERE